MADWYGRLEMTIGKHVWRLLESAHNEISRPDVKFGSPIEEMLATAMVAMARMYGIAVSFQPSATLRDVQAMKSGPQGAVIVPQADVLGHRVDFIVVLTGVMKFRPIIVECDGHDFHERTKEQAARDRSRDREFQSAGNLVMRFTGSEIWNDALACAEQIIDLIDDHRTDDLYAHYLRSVGEVAA